MHRLISSFEHCLMNLDLQQPSVQTNMDQTKMTFMYDILANLLADSAPLFNTRYRFIWDDIENTLYVWKDSE